MAMNYKSWLLEIDEHIAHLMLNRPEAMNAITPETLHELRTITQYLKDRQDVWVVILQGVGANFSVGMDVNVIGQMMGQDREVFRHNMRGLQDCLDVFEALEKPTIAKIRGYCIGGGLILALCCDFRIAAESANFSVPEVKRGIAVLMGTQRIIRVAGVAAAKEMIMLGERFDAQTALKWGLLHQVAADEALDLTVSNVAEKFAHLPPLTVGIIKRIIQRGGEMNFKDSQLLEIESQVTLLNTEDFKEGVTSFFEKRPPQFKGK